MMLKFVEINSNEPNLTQKQICNQIGFSVGTIKRYRGVIIMESPCKRNKYRKKKNKSNSTLIHSQTHTTNETPKNNKNNKNNKKNDLKGGSVLENDQKDNTKFIKIVGKMVDNV